MGSGLGKRLNGEIGESWRHCHAPLQGIFPTQGTNPRLLHWQVDFLPLSHQGSPSLPAEVGKVFCFVFLTTFYSIET